MFKWFFADDSDLSVLPRPARPCLIEDLEPRQLLSASATTVATHVKHQSKHVVHAAKVTKVSSKVTKASQVAALAALAGASMTTSTSTSSSGTSSSGMDDDNGQLVNTIQFSQAPTAVQNGLDTLATTDSLSAPTSAQTVFLGNSNGVETYTIQITSSGTVSRLTVDASGIAITQPTQTTITFGTLSGTGSNAAATAELTAIATALGLTAPTSTTVVNVSTSTDGKVTYSLHLDNSSTTTTSDTWYDRGEVISVDANGNPVGHELLPFSVMPTAVQNGINGHLPTGATALPTTSTQNVNVQTLNGLTYYSTTFTSSGTSTIVTVNAAGALATLPSQSTVDFSTLPTAAQTELQTLAAAAGFTGTITGTQTVTVFDEGNGTKVYSVTVSATDSTTNRTYNLTVSSDQLGNPTVPPNQHGGCGGDDFGGSGEQGANFGGGHGRGRHH
jgi:hypothetical protein